MASDPSKTFKLKAYDPGKIEKKWQKEWETSGVYVATDSSTKEKCYVLDMFPYPSGDGLHVGHPRGYIATDIYSRLKRMQGFNVLHPMGWDAFGLPAENYAIKNKIHPREAVEKNIKRFKAQLSIIGFDYDWSREINTTDSEYYKWTQWIFLQLYKKGLAYESYEPINWCPSCQTGLANEDVEDGKCERCGTTVEKKPMRQWVLKITDYADRLLKDLETLEWPTSIKESQKNWIGKSEGALIKFAIDSEKPAKHLEIFTTRPDTIFGVTFLAIAPELALKWMDTGWKPEESVITFVDQTLAERKKQSFKDNPEKTGVFSGVYAVNPANQEKIPVWITNYVLGDVGTGAVMAVPAHDDRDLEFAIKFDLEIRPVIAQVESPNEIVPGLAELKIESIKSSGFAHTGSGLLFNSVEFDGLNNEIAKQKITEKFGEKKTTYKLKDWVFSRQRYWGEPIPIVHCEKCGVVPIPEEDLPVKLPEVKSYAPTGTGESPLADIAAWVNTTCPTCQGPAKRETNTMPQWAGSSWYYLRFMDPTNKTALVDPQKEKYWAPVDVYVGGSEHATRHLIYARFWHKFLYDIGVVSTSEPFKRIGKNLGLILGADGRKMSKRWGNVVNPDDVIKLYGADTLRLYEMFMGPFDQEIAWNTDSMIGTRRFLERIWKLQTKVSAEIIDSDITHILRNQTIKKVEEDIVSFNFNTAVSSLMIFANHLDSLEAVSTTSFEILLQLLAPFAPHIAEELWSNLGHQESIHVALWPKYDPTKLEANMVTLVVQVNGKVRDTFEVERGADEKSILSLSLGRESVIKWLNGNTPKKIIFVPDKLINIVV